jgi:hypothetical protein
MLTTEQLEKNKAKFLETNEKYGLFTEELLNFLGDDFYDSPASTSLDMFGAYPGGLLHHLIKSCTYAIKVNETLPAKMKCDIKSIVRVTFLSQIGKVDMFELNDNNWEIEKLKKVFKFKEVNYKLKNSDKSLFLIMQFNIKLSLDEFYAITELDSDYERTPKQAPTALPQVVKMGFNLAIMEDKLGKMLESNG